MTKDEQIGISWWNNLLQHERVRVLVRACKHKEDASVADAYAMWRQGIISTEPAEQEGDEPVI